MIDIFILYVSLLAKREFYQRLHNKCNFAARKGDGK